MKQLIFHIIFLLLICFPTEAHEIRPGYLEIREEAGHSLQITWKQPLLGEYGVPLHPSISTGWMIDSLAKITYTESYLIKRWKIQADPATLNEQTIKINGLEKTMTDVLVQVNLLSGTSFTYLVKPIRPYVNLKLSTPPAPPVWQYAELGVFHIWSGFDHLLFVLGLLLLVKNRSKLIWTITAFTVAHSITLALATLHIIKISGSFTEAAIALSIVFLAVELIRHYRGKNGFAYFYPWLVSFLFGLLHGLGFAGALQDVGLPEDNIPFALLLFNVGVELGQLTFVGIVLLAIRSSHLFNFRFPKGSYQLPAYVIGTLAMYWFIERLSLVF